MIFGLIGTQTPVHGLATIFLDVVVVLVDREIGNHVALLGISMQVLIM